MRLKFVAAASILALGMASAAFAQPQYSSDYTTDSDGFAPSQVSPPKPVHYSNKKAPEYSSDYTNDSDGFAPSKMAAAKVDTTSTASIKPLPDCHSMLRATRSSVHTQGGDGGASRTDACRAMH